MRSTLGTPSDIEVDAGSTSILATNRRAPGWGSRSRVASAHVTALGDLDRDRIRELHDAELAWFRAERPRTLELLARAAAHMPNGTPMTWMASDNDLPVYVDHGAGASFTDVDGHSYVDFNVSDLAKPAP